MNSYPETTGMFQNNGYPMTRNGAPVDSSGKQLTNGVVHRPQIGVPPPDGVMHRSQRGVTPPARRVAARRVKDSTCYSDTEAMGHPRRTRSRSRSRSKQKPQTHEQSLAYTDGCRSACDDEDAGYCGRGISTHYYSNVETNSRIPCDSDETVTCACNMPSHCRPVLPGSGYDAHAQPANHQCNAHTHQCGRTCMQQHRHSDYVYPCSDSEVKTRTKSWETSRAAHYPTDVPNHVTTPDMHTLVQEHVQHTPHTAYRDMRTHYVTGMTVGDNAHVRARVQDVTGFPYKLNLQVDDHNDNQQAKMNNCVHDVTVHSPKRNTNRCDSDVTRDKSQTNINTYAIDDKGITSQTYFHKAVQEFEPAKHQTNQHTPVRDVTYFNPQTNLHKPVSDVTYASPQENAYTPAPSQIPRSHSQISKPIDATKYKNQTKLKPKPSAYNNVHEHIDINSSTNIHPQSHDVTIHTSQTNQEINVRLPTQNVQCVTAEIHEHRHDRIPDYITTVQQDCETPNDKQQTDWNGVMQDLFYNLDVVDCTDPIVTLDQPLDQTIEQTLEHTYDSSSGIASNTSTNKSTSKMSVFRGDNSSISSADKRYSDDSSFETRQFSDSSVSVDKQYVKKRQGEGKFPWAYTHGAKHAIKVARQNQTNKERTTMAGTPRTPGDYVTPVISHKSPHPVDYNYNNRHGPLHVRFDMLDLQDTDKLMFTSNKGKSKLIRPSYFDLMTDDIIVKIFSNLPTDQLCRCSCVCQRWYSLAWDPLLWKRIMLNDENIYVDRALKYLTKRLSYNTPTVCVIVEKINLSGCEKLTDKGLHYIAKRCPELRHLEIRGCANVTNTALFEVVSYCVNLEYLDVTGCERITNIRLTDSLLAQATAHHLRQIYLRYLDMSDCDALDDNGLVSISTYCSQLQFLFLRRCSRIGDVGLSAICNNCPNLRELSISDCKRVTDYGVSEISKLGESLRYLSVAKCDKVSDVGIIQVARGCKKLRYVNVRGCEAVSDDSLDTIARNLSRLKSLDIGKCDVTDEGLMALAYCSQLKRLSVKSCDSITDEGIVTVAHGCRKLQQLNMQDCHVTLEAYRTVKKCCKRCLIEHTNPGFC